MFKLSCGCCDQWTIYGPRWFREWRWRKHIERCSYFA